jgi:thiamine biosynthesis protein ThiI
MNKIILLRYGEIYLKGKNRGFFESSLLKNIYEAIIKIDANAKVKRESGRYFVFNFSPENLEILIERISKVFGLVSLSIASEVENQPQIIKKAIKQLIEDGDFNELEVAKTFKIDVNRADKKFPIQSNQFERELGGVVLDIYPNLKVNLTNPEVTIFVDIRENGKTFIFSKKIKCVGGMPVGTSGKALVMLSGGIDSPVATYMMAKRGLKLSAVHFHSYPYTSEQAKQKVIRLAEILTQYTGNMDLYCVSFTKIQEEIHKNCKSDYMITIMRRIMMRICEKLAEKYGFQAVITGENLAQVASQTVESMTSTESVLKSLPVFRPVIGFDKQEIVEIAQKIGTFDTSIQPYEDCCTVFLPKSPIIKPKLENVEIEESKIDIEFLVEQAIQNVEILKIGE